MELQTRPFSLFPAKERVKKSRDATTLRHSRESGNLLRHFRKKNRPDIADDRLRIPAFKRVKKSGGPHYDSWNAEEMAQRKIIAIR